MLTCYQGSIASKHLFTCACMRLGTSNQAKGIREQAITISTHSSSCRSARC